MSETINALQVFGKDLQEEFGSINAMSRSGRDSSGSLDDINKKILANSNDIRSITGIIDDFFERINLLSLNASIEAARAGEHGRGFAVVADEIGKLADSSSTELKKISDLIDTNRRDVESANVIIEAILEFIETLGRRLQEIQDKAAGTLNIIDSQKSLQSDMLVKTDTVRDKSEIIKNATAEQSIAIQEVVKSIENTNLIVQQISTHAQVLKDNYDRLRQLADDLNVTITVK